MAKAVPAKTERNEKIKKLNKEGVSYNELAKRYDISVQRIHQIIKNYKPYGKRHAGGACFFCKGEKRLQTHHADGDTSNTKSWNEYILCEPCHKKFHKLAGMLKN